ncbi:pyruvate dehydrogenase (acetyl-transferring), homodimeric type [Tropheryma whipplei]|uniref:pyruvate dehydrogenase (acetyl-transferring), homodimeric type n=1 Tax=Tropheryma whipplei TaxID=2039 RepID=UPI0004BBB6CE|nr:pyruvate dehydrogenase (acetyl-transferring), homodimeric type [Tropheryma whipplei]
MPPARSGFEPTSDREAFDAETQEWLDSLDALIHASGNERAGEILSKLLEVAKEKGVPRNCDLWGPTKPGTGILPSKHDTSNASNKDESACIWLPRGLVTNYVNTITGKSNFPGDERLETEFLGFVRWNAAVMVHRAQESGVGGHISTYASSALLYEIGFNHFFKGPSHPSGADQVFFQGHASPGIYARSFLEGRLSESDLDGFRQEKSRSGVPSYPHPRCMQSYWQFPTVSMGLGAINAIYQAQTNKYLTQHGIKDCSQQKVWAFLGDGEMDEPESRGQLQVASNDGLDNLIFVINCNLQRLDGPVRGNGKIIQELEAFFKGAGWKTIKVVWGAEWDDLFEQDTGELIELLNEVRDGDFQTYKANGGSYMRTHLFGKNPKCLSLVGNYTDNQLDQLSLGGHDFRKIYAAYFDAVHNTDGRPTVILAHTIKGYGLGQHFEGRNATHQIKTLTLDEIKLFRNALGIPISDKQIEKDPALPPYYNPGPTHQAVEYALKKRNALGGRLPFRSGWFRRIDLPSERVYDVAKSGSESVASTAVASRIIRELLKSGEFGKRIAVIIPDEARTFGMDAYFPSAKIYNPMGQHYTPVDHKLFLKYEESTTGQVIHVGINEAGAMGAFSALGTSYATHGEMLVPFYIFYSMFGFQRTGDAIWAAADQMARGFLLGAVAGRTTLAGEGLQHGDGHSHLLASTNPAVIAYDPAFGYEIGNIIQHGLEIMYGGQRRNNSHNNQIDPDVIFYLTLYNEPIHNPPQPDDLDLEGLIRGIYKYKPGIVPVASVLASGIALPWALEAQEILKDKCNIDIDVWSVTSWSQLARDGYKCEKHNVFNPEEEQKIPYVTQRLRTATPLYIGVSDYMRAVPEQIRPFVPGDYITLGTDGFGFSDTRSAARRFFQVDTSSIVIAVLSRLAKNGLVDKDMLKRELIQYRSNRHGIHL